MKKIISLATVLVLCLSLTGFAFAGTDNPYVYDEAGLFTQEELAAAEEKALGISNKYGYDLVVLFINETKGMTTKDYTYDFYDTHAYKQDCMLLTINFSDNEWYILTLGALSNFFTNDELVSFFEAYNEEHTYLGGVTAFTDAVMARLTRDSEGSIPDERLLPRLVDEAGLLSPDEAEALLNKLDEISESRNCDVVVVTVYSLDGKTPTEYADDFYDYNGYGKRENRTGILLLLSMESRKWAISTCGEAIQIFTDSAQSDITDRFLGELSDGNYYEAFEIFADNCNTYIESYDSGTPITDPSDDAEPYVSPIWILLCLGGGFLIALIPMQIMKNQHFTAVKQEYAFNYMVSEPIITRANEFFLYSTISRREIPQESSSGSGSSTHISSSGSSHGGSSGSF